MAAAMSASPPVISGASAMPCHTPPLPIIGSDTAIPTLPANAIAETIPMTIT